MLKSIAKTIVWFGVFFFTSATITGTSFYCGMRRTEKRLAAERLKKIGVVRDKT